MTSWIRPLRRWTRRVRARSRRGMTLVEVMVAVVVLLVMALIVAESLQNSVIFHQVLDDRDITVKTARVVMGKLKRDLQLAYLTPIEGKNPDRYRTVFVGFDDNPDKLFFASLNHQRLYLDTRESDQTEITIWAEPADKGDGYTLFHREAPRIDEEPAEQGTIWPLAYNVRSFSLRYLDQQDNEWKETWDSRSGDTPYRLPRAVEIALVLIAPDPESDDPDDTVDVPFVTQVALEWAPRLPTQNPQGLGGAGGLASRVGVAANQAGGGSGVGGAGVGNGFFNAMQFNKGGMGGTGAQGIALQGSGIFNGGTSGGSRNRNAAGGQPAGRQPGRATNRPPAMPSLPGLGGR